MFDNLKKSIEKVKNIDPKSLWLSFSQSQRVNRRDYVDMLTQDTELKTLADERRLEAMVGEQIKADFPEITDKSFELLVDATMHLIRKKQLQATDDICFK
ncbi:MAG: hypothetical protein NC200_00635 [Candidatus Gastranaerophilales bacterium]|nr:hypothetical protein [Candidatus Gastranaerophilales bacterium]